MLDKITIINIGWDDTRFMTSTWWNRTKGHSWASNWCYIIHQSLKPCKEYNYIGNFKYTNTNVSKTVMH